MVTIRGTIMCCLQLFESLLIPSTRLPKPIHLFNRLFKEKMGYGLFQGIHFFFSVQMCHCIDNCHLSGCKHCFICCFHVYEISFVLD